MSDLLTMLREHDIPPRWDGLAVVWEGWQHAPPVHWCSARLVDVCEGCGRPTTHRGYPCWSVNWGLMPDRARLTHEDYAAENAPRARLPESLRHKRPRRWWVRLQAYRCHHCDLDTVHDTRTGLTWTLDHADYSDTGSVAP